MDAVIAGVLGRAGAQRVDLALEVGAPSGVVWAALVEPDRVVAWLGRLEPGPHDAFDRFALRHDEATTSWHTVLAWEPGRRLEVTWEFPGERPSRLSVDLTPTTVGTRLALHHLELEDPISYAAGWHRHLEYLVAHLGGVDTPPADFWTGHDELVTRYQEQQVPGDQTKGEL